MSQINEVLTGHEAITAAQTALEDTWASLYSGQYLADATLSFGATDIQAVLRLITLTFTPSPGGGVLELDRLSDGQKSLMYIALVLALHRIRRRVLHGDTDAFDPVKMRPAIFTLVAVEEPENSLSPHYVGRIITALRTLAREHDAQAVLATHAPVLMRRIPPEDVRYLRLNEARQTAVRPVLLPDDAGEAHKFVREAVQAFPELYFARLVVLGEGDTEEIILPRLLRAYGIVEDEASVVVAPLGGRHVNHFWRLLHGLGIPHVTLLDLDLGRHGGGWGRIMYAATQLRQHAAGALPGRDIAAIPQWDSDTAIERATKPGSWLRALEEDNVFFSGPLDLDLSMLQSYPDAYGVGPVSGLAQPDQATIEAVLGKNRDGQPLGGELLRLLADYLRLFKRASKPVSHIAALADLTDEQLRATTPPVLKRLIGRIGELLDDIPA